MASIHVYGPPDFGWHHRPLDALRAVPGLRPPHHLGMVDLAVVVVCQLRRAPMAAVRAREAVYVGV